MASRAQLKVLLLQVRHDAGDRARELASVCRASKLAPEQIVAWDAIARPPDESLLNSMHALFIGGSKYSVFEDTPNLAALEACVKAARERRIPVFGICFGAQLIAKAFGGEVVRDDEREEYGTFSIRGSEEAWTDMLFADAPDEFPAQCAHRDRIARVPAGATVLASSDRCSVHAFSMPGDVYGFQFHPERSRNDFESIIHGQRADNSDEPRKLESMQSTLRDSPDAEAMVAKFVDRIVLARRS